MTESTRVFSGAPWENQVGYCRAVKRGSFISVSGTAPIAKDGSVVAPGDGYAQAKRCLEIIESALIDLGSSISEVMRTRMFVTNIALWADFGRAHAEVFGDNPPATTMVEVKSLIDPAMLIEIEADALAATLSSPSALAEETAKHVAPRDAHNIIYRPALPSDSAGIAERLGELGYPSTSDQVIRRLGEQSIHSNAAFVAASGPDILGFVAVQKNTLQHRDGTLARITALVVSTQVRAAGIGRQLIVKAEEWARAGGCDRIELTSGNLRTDAHAFYRRVGYDQTGLRFSRNL